MMLSVGSMTCVRVQLMQKNLPADIASTPLALPAQNDIVSAATTRQPPLPQHAASAATLRQGRSLYLFIYLFIYYTVYTHIRSLTIVKNRKCGQVTSHWRKARPYRADLSLFLNVPVVTVTIRNNSLRKTIPDCR